VLLARARDGDIAARGLVLERHLALVRRVAAHYRGLGLPTDDLVQEGAIALLGAMDTFDPERGAAFSTYAYWPVRCAIGRAVAQRGRVVRLPRRVIAARDGRTAATGAYTASLDAPVDDSGTPLGEVIADANAPDPLDVAARHERDRVLAAAVEHLPPRRRYVIEHHFGLGGEPQTLSDLAADLHISRQRAQAIKDDGLRALAAELDPARLGAADLAPARRVRVSAACASPRRLARTTVRKVS